MKKFKVKMSPFERVWPYSYQAHLPAERRLTLKEAKRNEYTNFYYKK